MSAHRAKAPQQAVRRDRSTMAGIVPGRASRSSSFLRLLVKELLRFPPSFRSWKSPGELALGLHLALRLA